MLLECLSDIYFEVKRFEAAIEVFLKYVEEPVENYDLGRILIKVGISQKHMSDLAAEVSTYERILQEGAESAWWATCIMCPILRLGEIYASRNDHVLAINLFENTVELYSDLWWAWQLLRNAYEASGNFEKAANTRYRAAQANSTATWALSGDKQESEMVKPFNSGILNQLG